MGGGKVGETAVLCCVGGGHELFGGQDMTGGGRVRQVVGLDVYAGRSDVDTYLWQFSRYEGEATAMTRCFHVVDDWR